MRNRRFKIKHNITTLSALSLLMFSVSALSANAPVIDATHGNNQTVGTIPRQPTIAENSYSSYQEQSTTSSEIKELRGQVELQAHQIQKLQETQNDLYQQIDLLKKQLDTKQVAKKTTSGDTFNVTTTTSKGSGKVTSGSVKTNTATSLGTVTAGESDNADEEAYLIATTQIKEKQYTEAKKSLINFLNHYPKSKYRASSHYWLGQLYLNENSIKLAKNQFINVLSYSDKTRKPNSLLKLGDIAIIEEDNEKAKTYYQQVITQYSNSEQATTAKRELAKLQ